MNVNQFAQMELGLDGKSVRRARQARRQRRVGAKWWFAQMRRVVDSAMEWRPGGAGANENDDNLVKPLL